MQKNDKVITNDGVRNRHAEAIPKGERLQIGVDTLGLRRLKGGLPKILEDFNKLRSIIKSVLKSDNIPGDFKKAFKMFCDHVMDGHPDSVKLSWAAQSKGLESEFKKAASLYQICKDFAEANPGYMQYMTLDKKMKVYVFTESIDNLLNEKAGQYLVGSTAIALYNKVRHFLGGFTELIYLQEGRVLFYGADVLRAIPLLKHNLDQTISPDHITIQKLANRLDAANLDETTMGIFNQMLNDEKEKQSAKQ